MRSDSNLEPDRRRFSLFAPGVPYMGRQDFLSCSRNNITPSASWREHLKNPIYYKSIEIIDDDNSTVNIHFRREAYPARYSIVNSSRTCERICCLKIELSRPTTDWDVGLYKKYESFRQKWKARTTSEHIPLSIFTRSIVQSRKRKSVTNGTVEC
jgi:hypothetical protein